MGDHPTSPVSPGIRASHTGDHVLSPLRRLTSSNPFKSEAHLQAKYAREWEHEEVDIENRKMVAEEVHAAEAEGFQAIASRLTTMSALQANSPAAKWLKGLARVTAGGAARRMREAARLKALQRTPYPMVLARIKLLLDRLQMFKTQAPASPGSRSLGSSMARKSSILRPDPGLPSFKSSGHGTKSRTDWADFPDGGPMDEASAKAALDKLMEELGITFAYVSEFLRKVPEETRLASIMSVRMENYKKDQMVYKIGDEPEKFYIILTGAVEVWTHPPGQPRERSVLASLKKGQSFGDHAILNQEPRADCVTPISNCTFLTVERDAFDEVFGAYFREKLSQAQAFFRANVDLFKKVSSADGLAVIRHMLLSTHPAGREWEPQNEQQIYFIKEGSATLESHDRKSVTTDITRTMLGLQEDHDDIEAPAMAESGVLANVVLKNGRAIGTLGHEEEMRRLRRQLIPKRTIAVLTPGSHFGGGPLVLGEGDLQSSLRVLAATDLEVYHCHVEVFMRHASPALASALRDDATFKLTYYYGRVGTINADTVVGHGDSMLLAGTRNTGLTDGDPLAGPTGASLTRATGQTGSSKPRRKKQQKHVHEFGKYNPEVERALQYIRDLQAHFATIQSGAMDTMAKARLVGAGAAEGVLPVPGYMEYLVSKGGTPAERFWAQPAVSGTARSNAIAPLLQQVYPEGLGPLSEKLDDLIGRTVAVTQEIEALSPPGSPSAGGAQGPPPPTAFVFTPSMITNTAAKQGQGQGNPKGPHINLSPAQVERIKGLTALAHGQPITPRATFPKSRPGTSPSPLPALARTPSPGADGVNDASEAGPSTRPGTAGTTDSAVHGQYSPLGGPGGTSSSPVGRYNLQSSGGWAANSSFSSSPRGGSSPDTQYTQVQQQLQQLPSSAARPSVSGLRGSSRAASRGVGSAPGVGGGSFLARASAASEQHVTQQLSRFGEAAAAAAAGVGGGLSIRTRVNPEVGTGSSSPLGRGGSRGDAGQGPVGGRSQALRLDSSSSSRPGTSGQQQQQQQSSEQQLQALWSSYPGPSGSTSAGAYGTGGVGAVADHMGSPKAGGVVPSDPYQPGSPGGLGPGGSSQGASASFWNLGMRRQASPPRQGALTAAGVLWVRSQDVSAAPVLRQCLTYEEIARLKAEGRRPATAAGALQ